MAAPNPQRLPIFFADSQQDSMTAEQFINHVQDVGTTAGWTPAQRLAGFKSCLRGRARTWMDHMVYSVANHEDWDTVRVEFIADFRRTESATLSVNLMETLLQKPNEDVTTFFLRIFEAFKCGRSMRPAFNRPQVTAANTSANFAALADDDLDRGYRYLRNFVNEMNDDYNHALIFRHGLRQEIRQRFHDRYPVEGFQTAKQHLKLARDIEISLGLKTTIDKPIVAANQTSDEVAAAAAAAAARRGHARGRGRAGSRGSSSRGSRGSAPSRGGFTGNCFNCNRPGHRQADCRAPGKVGETSTETEAPPRDQHAQNQANQDAPDHQYQTFDPYGQEAAVVEGFYYEPQHLN